MEDPRDQLVQQLLEYRQIKENAKANFLPLRVTLRERSEVTYLRYRDYPTKGEVATADLWNTLKKLARKNGRKCRLRPVFSLPYG